MRPEFTEAQSGVELPQLEPIRAQAGDDIGEQNGHRKHEPNKWVIAVEPPQPESVAEGKENYWGKVLVEDKEFHMVDLAFLNLPWFE